MLCTVCTLALYSLFLIGWLLPIAKKYTSNNVACYGDVGGKCCDTHAKIREQIVGLILVCDCHSKKNNFQKPDSSYPGIACIMPVYGQGFHPEVCNTYWFCRLICSNYYDL